MQWCLSKEEWENLLLVLDVPKDVFMIELFSSDLSSNPWRSSLCIRALAAWGGSHCVLTGGDVTQTCCWELRDSLSLQEFHRNGHRQKKDVRHHVIDSWWCRNLCSPIKTHKPHRALHAIGSYHCPFHPVFCSTEDFFWFFDLFSALSSCSCAA